MSTGGQADDRVIALVQYPGMTILDLVGPLQVLTTLELFAPRYRTVVVAERAEAMDTDVGVRMTPDRTFAEVPHPYAVVVPGGRQATIRAMSDPVLREYVRTAAASAEVVGSVCTGSLILAALGLLDGRPATTNWAFRGLLAPFGAAYHRRRWVEDGNVIMSAGVSAGIDMALHLVSRLTDEATARRVQLALDYDPQPPLGRIDWDSLPATPRLIRGAIGLLAPVLVRKAQRQLSADRAALGPAPGAGLPGGLRGSPHGLPRSRRPLRLHDLPPHRPQRAGPAGDQPGPVAQLR